jgi:Alginate export
VADPRGHVQNAQQDRAGAKGGGGLVQYFFWRASNRDALYNAAGAVLRPGTATDARYVGAELDLLVNYQFDRHLLGYVGYSHFFTGAFINRSGPDRNSDFVYAALQYTF